MTRIVPTYDADAVIAALIERVEALERMNFLQYASIDAQPGLAVKVPEGIDVKDGSSIAVQGDSGIDLKDGSSLKVGASGGKIGPSGSKIGMTGNVEVSGGVKAGAQVEGTSLKSTGDVNADGIVRGYAGVMAPYKGSMTQLGPAVESAYDLADSKPTVAYVDGKFATASSAASTAQTRANNAMTVANNGIDYTAAVDAKVADQIEALWDRIETGSGTKTGYPITPPPVKG